MNRVIVSTIFLFFAFIQWSAIYERSQHAYIHWKKFADYGGSHGHTLMSIESIIFLYVISIVIIIFGYIIQKYVSTYRIPNRIIQMGISLLFIGLIAFTILIITPFSRVIY